MSTVIKLRSQPSGSASAEGKVYRSCSLTVPREIAEALDTAGVTTFEVVLTDEGILYKPYVPSGEARADLPAWLKAKA